MAVKNSSQLPAKLARLIEAKGMSHSAIAREVKVSQPQIGYYLQGGSPNATVLMNMAEFFETTIEWLVNDDIPVDSNPQGLTHIPDAWLMDEVVRRYKLAAKAQIVEIQTAEQIDWEQVARQLFHVGLKGKVSNELQRQLGLAANVSSHSHDLGVDAFRVETYLQHDAADTASDFAEMYLPESIHARLDRLQNNEFLEVLADCFISFTGESDSQRNRAFKRLERLVTSTPGIDPERMKDFPLSDTMACRKQGSVEKLVASVMKEVGEESRKWRAQQSSMTLVHGITLEKQHAEAINAILMKRLSGDIAAYQARQVKEFGSQLSSAQGEDGSNLPELRDVLSSWLSEFYACMRREMAKKPATKGKA